MQYEITERAPLLNEHGDLRQAGYAKKLLPVYRRADIKANALRIKEWDYYLVMNDHFGLALTIADNSYMGLDSISFLHFDEGWEQTVSPMKVMTRGKTGLPETSETGDVAVTGKHYAISFTHEDGGRKLTCRMQNFHQCKDLEAEILLTEEPRDSMVIATPFEKPKHFYYNQKILCMRAAGTAKLGEQVYTFDPADSFGILDWGRGVWTYSNTWYWGAASGLVGGIPFGFNIGYGFGDTSAASENMVFLGGIAHKLDQVRFEIPGNDTQKVPDYMKPWKFTSNDGRFEMDFEPVLNRASCTDVKLIKSDQNQVFGRFSGTVILDDGSVIEIKNLMGFAEKVINKW